MKYKNLKILQYNGFNVPEFTLDIKKVNWELSAVRSSANIEDLDGSSCAGLFDSYLNVPKEELEEKIELVRESYIKSGGSKDSPVVIQRMIDSEISGVMFTANPTESLLNECIIVCGSGLGENVVEDKVDTTTYFYNVDDNIYTTVYGEDSPILSVKKIKELIEVGKKIEKLFGKPMDIEFAIESGVLYILQARPITTLCGKGKIILDNSNIVESYPGVSAPLTRDFVKEIYYQIFRYCCLHVSEDYDLVNSMDSSLRDMVDSVNGRMYYRISNWYSVYNLLPFSSIFIRIWQQMLGVRNKEITKVDIKVPLRVKKNICKNIFKKLKSCPEDMERLNEFFKLKFETCREDLNKIDTVEGILSYYEDFKDVMISNWDTTLINDMYAFVYTFLAGKKNKGLLSDIKDLESLKPVRCINTLIDLEDRFGVKSIEFIEYFDWYISEYGDRCLSELKLETKTYRTNPELLLEYIKDRELEEIKEDISDDKIKNRFVKKARIGIYNREISRMNRSRLFGFVREMFLKIGSILVEQGKIDCKEDVFYLGYDELYHLEKDLRGIIGYNKQKCLEYEDIPTYSRLVFEGEIKDKSVGVKNIGVVSDNVLYGVGTSEGIVEGEVLMVDKAELGIDTTDKIIVTKMTDPGWVFLIRNCKGIIAEQGSLLSHTAIISRELKKPAVVNVKNVLQVLKNGDIVRIDGGRGSIEIL